MTSAATDNHEGAGRPMHWGLIVVMVANIVVRRWRPGSIAATVFSYGFIGSMTLWFGLRIRTGYIRRRPYWTRESWLRYLRLAAMPVAAVVFVLLMTTETAIRIMGSARSTRGVSIVILMALVLFGGLGLATAVDWLVRGAASEQFTRRRWFQRRRTDSIGN